MLQSSYVVWYVRHDKVEDVVTMSCVVDMFLEVLLIAHVFAVSPAIVVWLLPSQSSLWTLKSPARIMFEQDCLAVSMPASIWLNILISLCAHEPGR